MNVSLRPTDAPERATAEGSPSWRRRLSGLTVRIIAWNVVMLVLALLVLVVTVRAVLLARLDEQADADLRQEVEELRTLGGGRDPETGEPFGEDIRRLFEVFLSRNIPSRNEMMLTFVDGEPFRRSIGEPVARLDLDPELVEAWREVPETDRGTVQHPEVGRVEYLAVPVRVDGDTAGVFLVAYFRDVAAAEIDEVVRVAGLVGLIVLVLAGAVSWNVADRVTQPVRVLTETARSISDSDFSQRIPVAGSDELALLADTFNRMLDRLEDAFATQRAFVHDAGHELRTPITIIRGHLDLLDHADPRERAETLALLDDELERMHRMVEDLLLLARAEQPDFLSLASVDLEAVTHEVHAKAQGLAEREWILDGVARAYAVADRQRLTQALVQLAQNAVQHTEPGDRITIGSQVQNGWARLWVRDSGPGVPEELRDRMFQRFVRGDRARQPGEGAGLGLAIVNAIATAHRGRVVVDSITGVGAMFTLLVPLDPEWPS